MTYRRPSAGGGAVATAGVPDEDSAADRARATELAAGAAVTRCVADGCRACQARRSTSMSCPAGGAGLIELGVRQQEVITLHRGARARARSRRRSGGCGGASLVRADPIKTAGTPLAAEGLVRAVRELPASSVRPSSSPATELQTSTRRAARRPPT